LPSNKILQEKQAAVAEIVNTLNGTISGVLVSYQGITVADDTKLRAELRKAGVKYKVLKNSLLNFAVKEAGLEGLTEVLEGTTALAVTPRVRPQRQKSSANTPRKTRNSSSKPDSSRVMSLTPTM